MFRSIPIDVVVIILIVLLFAGPKRLPMLSRSIGESIKEFKGGVNTDAAKQEKAEIPAAPAQPAPAPQAAPAPVQQAPAPEAAQSAPDQQA